METGSELFACQHSIHSYVKQEIRSLPVASKVQKRPMLKLPNKSLECFAKLAAGFCDEVLPYFKIKKLSRTKNKSRLTVVLYRRNNKGMNAKNNETATENCT